MTTIIGFIARLALLFLACSMLGCDPGVSVDEPECTAWARGDDGQYECTSYDPSPCVQWGQYTDVVDGNTITTITCVRRDGE